MTEDRRERRFTVRAAHEDEPRVWAIRYSLSHHGQPSSDRPWAVGPILRVGEPNEMMHIYYGRATYEEAAKKLASEVAFLTPEVQRARQKTKELETKWERLIFEKLMEEPLP